MHFVIYVSPVQTQERNSQILCHDTTVEIPENVTVLHVVVVVGYDGTEGNIIVALKSHFPRPNCTLMQ